MNRKGFAPILIIGIIALLIIAGITAWYSTVHENAAAPVGVACTQEAKECPDGSYVGRTGPNCEFAACPTVVGTSTIDTSGWKTYTNQQYGFTIRYPNDNQLVTDKSNAQIGFMYSPESCDQDTALACFSYKPDKFPGTNFNGSALSVNLITRDDDNGVAVTDAQTCSNFEGNWDDAGGRSVDGIIFRHINDSEGAGGHTGSDDDYIAFVNNHCFDIRIVSETISAYTDYGLTEMATTTQEWISDTSDKPLSSFAIMK